MATVSLCISINCLIICNHVLNRHHRRVIPRHHLVAGFVRSSADVFVETGEDQVSLFRSHVFLFVRLVPFLRSLAQSDRISLTGFVKLSIEPVRAVMMALKAIVDELT